MLRSILSSIKAGDVLLGDAYYCTYFLLCALVERGCEGLFEQHGARRASTDFRCGQRLGQRDHLVVLTKPLSKPDWMEQADYDRAPDQLTVREVCVGGKILLTTMLCARTTTKSELKLLYRARWNIELDLRNIKTTLGMEQLSCRTPQMAIKELWVYLLAYNLIRLMMAQAAALANCQPRQLSFKHTRRVGALLRAGPRIGTQHGCETSTVWRLPRRLGEEPINSALEPRSLHPPPRVRGLNPREQPRLISA